MLEARALRFRFRSASPLVEGVSLRVARGEIVGLGGRSGLGKTTLARLLAGHLRPQGGSIRVDGGDLPDTGFRPVQYVPQTPILAMNPRWRIGRILSESHSPDRALRAALQVDPDWDRRFPHELSGGQLQRVALLRALAPGTRYLVADEITSALDPITQAALWRELVAISTERGIGILTISHDEPLLSRVASRRYALTPSAAGEGLDLSEAAGPCWKANGSAERQPRSALPDLQNA